MEEQTITHTKPPAFTLDALGQASDQQLAELIDRATSLLTARENARKSEAITKIKELAKAHGLNVMLEPRNTKKGRRQRQKAQT
ncbi:hypothetical protein QO034_20595 [Sedimentitalea sp. JM2-8]|uniref:H-NS histone family protein n=1 Tax=Sedimentitalea xiamensis TaxID=3050037 RepID=A0ABT7FK92_9RHOB|nr:hypothetical protein [Sedimentitalea xiamensis]MDK3075478.1 hypothetical protein [Sedimentitalea xiamensis]